MSNFFWQGSLVRLRGIEPSDWEQHFVWDKDSEIQRLDDRLFVPRSQEATKQWAEKMALREMKGDIYFFEIENLAGELVGCISTHECDARTGTFRYGIAIQREHWRKGYASEAITIVLRYFFEELRYQKVTVNVFSFNDASIHMHERLGFQLEGRLRRMIYTQGQFFDELFYGMTAEEFREKHPE
ncbi:MAG TPA: GNAT family N-acetyltransferase [Ktedonobacteraceae bacterium]|nr:GNAT family N-acetyltransferase [Ktedonobacteraceae bacterium]